MDRTTPPNKNRKSCAGMAGREAQSERQAEMNKPVELRFTAPLPMAALHPLVRALAALHRDGFLSEDVFLAAVSALETWQDADDDTRPPWQGDDICL
jgi:hypothetical protein